MTKAASCSDVVRKHVAVLKVPSMTQEPRVEGKGRGEEKKWRGEERKEEKRWSGEEKKGV